MFAFLHYQNLAANGLPWRLVVVVVASFTYCVLQVLVLVVLQAPLVGQGVLKFAELVLLNSRLLHFDFLHRDLLQYLVFFLAKLFCFLPFQLLYFNLPVLVH